jgi:hypothetical protein
VAGGCVSASRRSVCAGNPVARWSVRRLGRVREPGPEEQGLLRSVPAEGAPARDSQPRPGYLFISTRPGDNVRNEFSVLLGFPLKEDADPSLAVGSDTFALYARQTGAWIRNVAEESRLIDTMRKGKDLTMKSTSVRGNVTTDRYSLSGLAQALDRVAQECK